MPATVKVRGEAAIRAEPDDALVMITVTALEATPGAALSDVSERSNALVAMLDRLGIARADRSTAGVTVHEEFDYEAGSRRSLGHRAVNQVSVRLTDHEPIGQLITEATEQLSVRIDGPRWEIAPSNPVRLQAAREAAADAQRRARAFAQGVGARLGRPLELSEDEDHPRPRRMHAVGRAAAADPLPVEPGEHEVVASINVTFALEFDDPQPA